MLFASFHCNLFVDLFLQTINCVSPYDNDANKIQEGVSFLHLHIEINNFDHLQNIYL